MASVARADIGQSMTVVGTVEPVNDASASFQVGGKVATVTTTVGEQVTAGQSLGTLDTTSLGESVSSAQSTVNSAKRSSCRTRAASPPPRPAARGIVDADHHDYDDVLHAWRPVHRDPEHHHPGPEHHHPG